MTERLFVTEEELAVIVLGKGRLAEWRKIALVLELRGFPKIDAVIGRRYYPAIRAFFDHEYGLASERPFPSAPIICPEADAEAWRKSSRRPASHKRGA